MAQKKVKVLVSTGKLVLVEWIEDKQKRRTWLPQGVPVTVEEARGGIPAGVGADVLEKLLEAEVGSISERLETALHNRGLFAAADAERIPESGRVVEAALCDAVRPLAALVLEIVRQEV